MGAKLSYPTVDLSGKVCIVTGASSGIGKETAKALYAMGAHVVMACRSEEKARMVMVQIKAEVSVEQKQETNGCLEIMKLDLACLHSTKQFVANFKSRDLKLHLLVNNAGIALAPKRYTKDGYESHFQVNHLSHFLLTLELLPILKSSTPDARIVFVASEGHRNGVFQQTNMQAEHSYSRMKFYGNSKLFNIMTAIALQRRLKGSGVTVSSLHPGIVSTDITRSSEDIKIMKLLAKIDHKVGLGRSPQEGSMTTLNAAVNPELNKEDAVYYVDCKETRPSSLARDEEKQEVMWRISCNLLKDYLSPEILCTYGPVKCEQAQPLTKTFRSLPDLCCSEEADSTQNKRFLHIVETSPCISPKSPNPSVQLLEATIKVTPQ